MKNVSRKLSDTEILVNCRFSYPHLFTPRSTNPNDPNAKPKYQMTLLISKNDQQAVKLVHDAEEAAKKLFVEKYGRPNGKLKSVVYDGDEERPDDDTCKNCIFVRSASITKPKVQIMEDGQIFDALDEQDVYAGAYGAAIVNFYPYSSGNSKGITAGLNGVLKLEDGDRLAGGGDAEAVFAGLV